MPPYHVNTTCTGINDFTYDKSNGYKDMEYLRKFPSRGNETNLTDNGKPVYRIPEIQTGYHLISGHKALPSGNWGGNLQPNVPPPRTRRPARCGPRSRSELLTKPD